MTGDRLYINGISGVTGEYVVPAQDFKRLASLIKGEPTDFELGRWLSRVWRSLSQLHLGLPFEVNPADVRQAGWAVVFHSDETQEVKDALAPLVAHRAQQVGAEGKVKVLEFRDGENRADWLARHRVGAGTVEPTKVPFYLLLVGSPERIPFSFGILLGVEYAVGRLHFDTASAYAHYVQSVIDYEISHAVPNNKEVVFFATRHPGDNATQLSADLLVQPLADGIVAEGGQPAAPKVADRWGFGTRKIWGEAATKRALLESLVPAVGEKSPAFLFTASHGMAWPRGDRLQPATQGALLCQEWPGFGTYSPDHYFAGYDVPADAKVHGMMIFHFACCSAGTPSHERPLHKLCPPPPPIAEQSFIATLPKTWLSHPRGGALACIGHVDLATGCSIVQPKAGPQLIPFQNAIGKILTGQPVGCALKDFSEKYAALSASLNSLLEELRINPGAISEGELVFQWAQCNDAEGYIIIGDPAVQLRVNDLQ